MFKHLATLALVQLKVKQIHAAVDLKSRTSTNFITQKEVTDFANTQLREFKPDFRKMMLDRTFQKIITYDPEIEDGISRWIPANLNGLKRSLVKLNNLKIQLYYLHHNINETLKAMTDNPKMKQVQALESGMVKPFRWEHMLLGDEHYLFGYCYVEADPKPDSKSGNSGLEGKVFLVTLPISKGVVQIAGADGKSLGKVKRIQVVALCSRNATEKKTDLPGADRGVAAIVQEMRAENICRLLSLAMQPGAELLEAWNTHFTGEAKDKFKLLFRYIFTTFTHTRYIPEEPFKTLDELDNHEIASEVMCIDPYQA